MLVAAGVSRVHPRGVRLLHQGGSHHSAMELPPELAVLYAITMGAGLAMVMRGLRAGKFKLRGVQRCVACGKITRSPGRCSCLDE
jgi:hypothetical protein